MSNDSDNKSSKGTPSKCFQNFSVDAGASQILLSDHVQLA
jgi:hypothetical protein